MNMRFRVYHYRVLGNGIEDAYTSTVINSGDLTPKQEFERLKPRLKEHSINIYAYSFLV